MGIITILPVQSVAQFRKGKHLKNKKLTTMMALLLALTMILAACAKPATTEAPADAGESTATGEAIAAEISVQAEEAWVPYYEAAIARVVEKNPDAKITVIQSGSFDMLDTVDSTGVTNPDVADVFAIPADRIYGLSANDSLAPVDSKTIAAELGGWSDFDAGIGGNFKVGEDYLAFPYNIETLIVFANKANAEAAGIDVTKPIEMNTITKQDDVLLPFFDAWYGISLVNSAEIELLGKKDDGTFYSDMTSEWADLAPEKQAAITALYDYWKKHNEAGTSLFDADAGWGYIDEAFKTGSTGVFRLGGPWDTATISEQAGGGADLEILPISSITVGGKPLTHWQGGWGLGINARVEGDADKMALAHALIKEIVNPEYAVDLFKATGKILENVKPEVYTSSDLSETDKKVIEAVIASYQDAPARPLFSEWGPVWDTWKNAVLSWNAQKPATVEDAYSQLKASFDSMMANIK